jgi:hypothetical protein
MGLRRFASLTLLLLPLWVVSACDSSEDPTPPVANAGPDQPNANVDQPVTLNGSGSYDAKNKPLTYSWTFLTRPAGSAAVLSGATTDMASFTPDVGGTYVVQLTVDNGKLTATDDCTITVNGRPIAEAGQDKLVTVGKSTQLDGSGSHDPEGDPLTYQWTFQSRPTGSNASLSNPSSQKPTFTPDKGGDYEIRLVVNDGALDSDPDECVISANTPPVANAGPDANTSVGKFYQLDGSGSSDPDGDALTYSWTLTSRPTGSIASLVNPNTAKPGFTADKVGDYVMSLIVSDGHDTSDPDYVTISAKANAPPEANAGPDQSVSVGAVVQLNGSQSSDPEGGSLEYSWAFVSRPSGSSATLANSEAVNPTFTPDVQGAFVVRLTVTDDGGLTDTDDVTITVGAAMSLTGTWSGTDPLGATWGLTLTENQSTGSVTGGAELSYQGTVILGGGSVSGSRTGVNVQLTISFSGYQPAVFTGTLSANGSTMSGQLNGSGYEDDPITFTRISGSSVGPAAVSEPAVPGAGSLREFLKEKVKGTLEP